jgi:glucose-6-phosphate 1-epimerase
VPIIFPQFSDMGPLTKHGFARTALWEVASAADSEVTLVLRSSEATRKLWPHDFEALFRVALVPHGGTPRFRVCVCLCLCVCGD